MGGSRVKRAQILRPILNGVMQRDASTRQHVLKGQAIRLGQPCCLGQSQPVSLKQRDRKLQSQLVGGKAGCMQNIIIKGQRHATTLPLNRTYAKPRSYHRTLSTLSGDSAHGRPDVLGELQVALLICLRLDFERLQSEKSQ